MLKAKAVAAGAIIFILLVSSAFILIFPQVKSKTSSIIGNEETLASKAGWAGARPLSLTNYMQRENDLMLILKNNSGSNLVIRKACISESECDDRESTVRAGSTDISLIEVKNDCVPGEEFSYSAEGITIKYTKNGQEKEQKGEFPLTGICT